MDAQYAEKHKLAFQLAVVGAIVAGVVATGAFSTLERQFSDGLYYYHAPSGKVVIVEIDDASLQQIGRWPWSRSEYVAFLRNVDNAKTVGIDVSFLEKGSGDEELQRGIEASRARIVLVSEYDLKASKLQKPVIAATSGYANYLADSDGVVRKAFLGFSPEKEKPFALLLAQAVDKTISIEDGARPLPRFYGDERRLFKTFSFADIAKGKVNASEFEGKIVLVGATAPDLHDFVAIPPNKRGAAGVAVHASVVENLLANSFLRKSSVVENLLVALLLAVAVVLLSSRTKVLHAALLSFLLLVGAAFFSIWWYDAGVVGAPGNYYFAVVIAFVASNAANYYFESKEKARVRGIFSRYVAPQVVEKILREKKFEAFSSEKREVSVLFGDVRGFTSMSEKLSPEQVVATLNEYLSEATQAAFDNDGTLDKYIGDCAMVVFNSPLDQPDHALRAVKTALEMVEKIGEVNRKTGKTLGFGIGIATGPAVVGSMGSPQRLDYTAIGDTVNLASRLSGAAAGGQVIINEKCFEEVKERVHAKELEPIKVKGKEKPVRVFEVTGLK